MWSATLEKLDPCQAIMDNIQKNKTKENYSKSKENIR